MNHPSNTPLWRIIAAREISTQLKSKAFRISAGLLVGATWGAYQARARGATIVLGVLAAAAGAAALGIAFGGG